MDTSDAAAPEEDNTRAQVDGFRVVDLKKELAARGLKTSGLKAVLKARILEALGLPAS